MLERKTITLPQPLTGHDGPIKQIVLREPTYEEFMSYGEPILYGVSPEGRPFAVENMEAIRSYVAVCLVEPKDPLLLTQASALVGREVKEKILSFFPVGGLAAALSETSPTTSPSVASDTSAPNSSSA